MKRVAVWTIAAAAGLLVAGLLFPKLGSHVSVAWHKVTNKLDRTVSPEWEVARLQEELARVDGDIRGSFGKVADQAVEVERIQKEVTDQRKQLDAQKTAIFTMKEDLEKGNHTIKYAGKEYSADIIRTKLSHEFETYKVKEKAAQSKEKMLKEKQAALEAAYQRLDEMKASKQQLEEEVARLESDLQIVRMEQAKASSKASFDDTRLGQAKEDVTKLSDRIASMRKELEIQGKYEGPKNTDVLEKASAKDVVKDVDDYFSNKGDRVAEQK